MLSGLIYSFVTLFVIVDPVGTATLFAGLTRDWTPAERRESAKRGVLVAGLLLLVFAFGGEFLLRALGISLAALRIAGGILLFLLATEMVLAKPSGVRGITYSEREEAVQRDDIAVFPLAFPLIAGPGALTSVVLLMGAARGPTQIGGVVVAGTVVLGLTLVALLSATRLVALLGVTGANVVGRVLGVVLAALAAQFVLDGISEWLPHGT
jgi:multiple antibiotic resistance protein